MQYYLEQISNQRWGIYCNNALLATIGCGETALVILKSLQDQRFRNLSPKIFQVKKTKKINQAA